MARSSRRPLRGALSEHRRRLGALGFGSLLLGHPAELLPEILESPVELVGVTAGSIPVGTVGRLCVHPTLDAGAKNQDRVELVSESISHLVALARSRGLFHFESTIA